MVVIDLMDHVSNSAFIILYTTVMRTGILITFWKFWISINEVSHFFFQVHYPLIGMQKSMMKLMLNNVAIQKHGIHNELNKNH